MLWLAIRQSVGPCDGRTAGWVCGNFRNVVHRNMFPSFEMWEGPIKTVQFTESGFQKSVNFRQELGWAVVAAELSCRQHKTASRLGSDDGVLGCKLSVNCPGDVR
jgi:hypothetical protein